MADTNAATTNAAAATASPTKKPTTATDEKQTNNVRVSAGKSRFLYVDVTKYLLEEGHATVEITGLGSAISDVADIIEILKSQGLIEVAKIVTCRDIEGARRRNTDKICITVKKSKDFSKIFAEQKKAKEAAQAEKEAKKETKKETTK